MTTIRTGTSLLASAALLGACAFLVLSDQPAFAKDRTEADPNAFAFGFAYNPEELQSDEAAAQLMQRLQHQIERRCSAHIGRMTLTERKLTQECVDATLQANIGKFGSDAIATSHENRTDG